MDKRTSAAQALLAALATALVSSGVISGETVSMWQPVVAAGIALVAALGIHSIRKK
jgi:hypothetical protein